jgi:hypothetical protein
MRNSVIPISSITALPAPSSIDSKVFLSEPVVPFI